MSDLVDFLFDRYAEDGSSDTEAKRWIVDEHGPRTYPGTDVEVCRRCRAGVDGEQRIPAPCATLRLLALPYRTHPGYRPEWALTVNA